MGFQLPTSTGNWLAGILNHQQYVFLYPKDPFVCPKNGDDIYNPTNPDEMFLPSILRIFGEGGLDS